MKRLSPVADKWGGLIKTYWIPRTYNEGFVNTGIIYQIDSIDKDGICTLRRIAFEKGKMINDSACANPESYLIQADLVTTNDHFAGVYPKKRQNIIIRYKVVSNKVINFMSVAEPEEVENYVYI
ncbi:MAG: hypothetical protein ACM34K_11175 [Bacillota bacterium]